MGLSTATMSTYIINKGNVTNGKQEYYCTTKPGNKTIRLSVPTQETDTFEKEYNLLNQTHRKYNYDKENNRGSFVLKDMITYIVGGLAAYSPFKFWKNGNKFVKSILAIPAFIIGSGLTDGFINAMLPSYKSELNYQAQSRHFNHILNQYKT